MKEVKIQVLELIVILVTVSSLFLWSHSESRSDSRRLEDLISTIHRETSQQMSEMHKEIYQEMKDFHGRLTAIEAQRVLGNKEGKD